MSFLQTSGALRINYYFLAFASKPSFSAFPVLPAQAPAAPTLVFAALALPVVQEPALAAPVSLALPPTAASEFQAAAVALALPVADVSAAFVVRATAFAAPAAPVVAGSAATSGSVVTDPIAPFVALPAIYSTHQERSPSFAAQ